MTEDKRQGPLQAEYIKQEKRGKMANETSVLDQLSTALRAAGYEIAAPMKLLGPRVFECALMQRQPKPQLSRLQVFASADPQDFVDQVTGHLRFSGTGITTTLSGVSFASTMGLPMLVYREAKTWSLRELIRFRYSAQALAFVAWDLIQAVRVAFNAGRPLGPLEPTRVSVSSDGAFRAQIHLFNYSRDPAHSHPDQLRALNGMVPQDVRYDLWSLGLVFFEMLLGVDLLECLATLLKGDVRPETIAAFYARFLAGDASFVEFCYPKLQVDENNAFFKNMRSLMDACMDLDAKPTDAFFQGLLDNPLFAAREKFRSRLQVQEDPFAASLRGLSKSEASEPTAAVAQLKRKMARAGLQELGRNFEFVASRVELSAEEIVPLLLLLSYPCPEHRRRITKTLGLLESPVSSKTRANQRAVLLCLSLLVPDPVEHAWLRQTNI